MHSTAGRRMSLQSETKLPKSNGPLTIAEFITIVGTVGLSDLGYIFFIYPSFRCAVEGLISLFFYFSSHYFSGFS